MNLTIDSVNLLSSMPFVEFYEYALKKDEDYEDFGLCNAIVQNVEMVVRIDGQEKSVAFTTMIEGGHAYFLNHMMATSRCYDLVSKLFDNDPFLSIEDDENFFDAVLTAVEREYGKQN